MSDHTMQVADLARLPLFQPQPQGRCRGTFTMPTHDGDTEPTPPSGTEPVEHGDGWRLLSRWRRLL